MRSIIFLLTLLLSSGSLANDCESFNDPNTQLNKAISQLIEGKDNSTAMSFIKSGMFPDQSNACKTTLLHIASIMNDLSLARELIALGGSPDKTNYQGQTPVFMAANWASNEILELLLNAGGNPNIVIDQESLYNTPLLVATINEHIKTVRLLISYGADPGYQNMQGISALKIAQSARNEELISALSM